MAIALPSARNGKLPDPDFLSEFPRLFFRQPDARHLGLAIRAARDGSVVERLGVLSCDRLDAVDAFGGGDVGEPRGTDDIADRVHARNIRPVVRVHLDAIPLNGDSKLLQSDVFHVSLDADRHECDVAVSFFPSGV